MYLRLDNISPNGCPVGRTRRRRGIPGEDGAHPDQMLDEAEFVPGTDLQGHGKLKRLGPWGIEDLEGLRALISPGGTAIVREIKAHIFFRTASGEVTGVATALLDVDCGPELFKLRVVANGADALVRSVLLDIEDSLEGRTGDVAKVVWICEKERAKILAGQLR